ncbi:polyprenyl synthetase family protein [Faecalicoccus acidiformans]|uniref:Polyprenyl synthetase family protein n=1 Tax=Faecalicoccus acidiformans TaxID=915173 RepID=A0ABS2FNF4_9FIRM|nr:farnesyl diphosphate synthase [Faecalicoccus acidiformans]MBM6830905.1 polyprenyl synthetase family protein [Faecalicoccus acidiformans]MDM8203903.1 polyprenyl synthetase family protein [Faecalicoccus acidiformans]
MKTLKNEFEEYLQSTLQKDIPSKTREAMNYSLMNGGKRVRPMILFALLQDAGVDPHSGFSCAGAIEMIHTYSLIHDDLPCMDDDDLRRGHPTCHKAFSEAIAVLAGDALLTKAFEIVLESDASDLQKVKLVKSLSECAGINGMILGQDLDMQTENHPLTSFDELKRIEIYKTGMLLSLPMRCACVLSQQEEHIEAWSQIGILLGIQFQIQDDILDKTQTSEVLGKSTSDEKNDKATAISLLGLQKASKIVLDLEQKIKDQLNQIPGDHDCFQQILNYLIQRKY